MNEKIYNTQRLCLNQNYMPKTAFLNNAQKLIDFYDAQLSKFVGWVD